MHAAAVTPVGAHVVGELVVRSHGPRAARRLVVRDGKGAITDRHRVVIERVWIAVQVLVGQAADRIRGVHLFDAVRAIEQPLIHTPGVRQIESDVGGRAVLGDVEAAKVSEPLGVGALLGDARAGRHVSNRDRPRVRRIGHQHLIAERPLVIIGEMRRVEASGQGVAAEHLLAEPQVVFPHGQVLVNEPPALVDDALRRIHRSTADVGPDRGVPGGYHIAAGVRGRR